MSGADPKKIAAALAAELKEKQQAEYEVRAAKDGYASAVLARKDGQSRAAGLLIRDGSADSASSAAANALAAKLAEKLKDKSGFLSILAPRAPKGDDVEAWSAAAAAIVETLEKGGVKTGSDLMTLDEPPAGSAFDYASWTPRTKGGLLLDVYFRSGEGAAKPEKSDAEDHWLVVVGEAAPAGKAVGRAFSLDLQGDAVSRAWWAEPKGSGFSFRRF